MAIKKTQRAFALFFALLFLFSSCALTGAVIYQMIQDNKKPDTGADSTIDSAQSKEKPVDESAKLQGKPLAGFAPIAKIEKLSGLDSAQGTGATVKAGDIVTVDYTGAVAATGIVFQSSKDTGQPVPLTLKQGSVIDGFVQGVPGMKVGGTRRLLIPANLAYGAQGNNGIPPNADLVFDVTVVKIGQ